MPLRRYNVNVPLVNEPVLPPLPSDSDDEDHFPFMAKCISCDEDYDPADAGTCKECYDEANETEEEMKKQIEELKAKVSFLALASPVDGPTTTPTDVILVATADDASHSIPAHKAVLVSRSPVFRAMLENDMEESRSGTIRVADVSYDALHAFFNFLYTAEASSLDSQISCNLLGLAEQYQVNHLKTFCEKYLIGKMNWEKALAYFSVANQHKANQLRAAALAFITDNMQGLTAHEDYTDLVQSYPRLVVEIYEAYLARQVNTAALNL